MLAKNNCPILLCDFFASGWDVGNIFSSRGYEVEVNQSMEIKSLANIRWCSDYDRPWH